MPNTYFRFKHFTVHQDKAAMKVCTDACLFGAWVADSVKDFIPAKILDIGTGTGLLSLMIAQEMDADIDAIDVDEHAFGQAAENFLQSPWAERLHAHLGQVQEYRPPYQYDLIIANPPFYESDLRSPDQQRNTAMHGSQLGFAELLKSTRRLLAKNGSAAFLIPAERHTVFESLLSENGFFIGHKMMVRQTERHAPFRVMYIVSERTGDPLAGEIMIKNEGVYSDEFNRLLEPYYL